MKHLMIVLFKIAISYGLALDTPENQNNQTLPSCVLDTEIILKQILWYIGVIIQNFVHGNLFSQ